MTTIERQFHEIMSITAPDYKEKLDELGILIFRKPKYKKDFKCLKEIRYDQLSNFKNYKIATVWTPSNNVVMLHIEPLKK